MLLQIVLLEHSRILLLIYCLWLLSYPRLQRPKACKPKRFTISSFEKTFPNPWSLLFEAWLLFVWIKNDYTFFALFSSRGEFRGTSLVVQWLRHHTSTARGSSFITSWGTKIPHASWNNQKLGLGWESTCDMFLKKRGGV